MEQQRRKTRTWSSYEDQRLIAAVSRFGLDNWSHVATFVGNGRTRAQCAQRWNRGLDPRISRDHWSVEEENKLISLIVSKTGKGWTHIASEMGNRSDVQCRYHYLQMKKEGRVPVSLESTPPSSNSDSSQAPSIAMNSPTSLGEMTQSIFNIPSEVHSLDYSDKSKFAYSPEPYFTPLPEQPPHSVNSQPVESDIIQIQNSGNHFSAFVAPKQQPNSYTPEEHKQEQKDTPQQPSQSQAFDIFNIPPPQYGNDPFSDLDGKSDSDFTIKLPEFNSSIYTLW